MSALLYSKEEGQGKTLLFLHGFCETHEIWNDFVKPLGSAFRIITIDLPGFGRSESLPTPFGIDDVGHAIGQWLIERQLTDAVVIGHSLGGYVSLSLLEYYPQQVGRLVLFHSTIFADTAEKKENRNKVIDFVSRHGVEAYVDTFVPGLFFDPTAPAVGGVHQLAAGTKKSTLISYTLAMRDRPDRSSIWKNSDIPKLIIAGMEDKLIPLETSQKMSKMAKNTHLLELKKTGHMGFFEAKTESRQAIAGFAD